MSICYINGAYRNTLNSVISIEDRGFNFADSVYEVIGFKRYKLLNIKKHIKRLKNSIKELQINKPFTNYRSLELIAKQLMRMNNLNEGFIYLQVTRGTAKRNHLFSKKMHPNIVITIFSGMNLKSLKEGVKVSLVDDLRWLRCDIKSTSLLPNVIEKQRGADRGFFEVWQVRQNIITEGTTSNAFIVNEKNKIITHPKNNLILGGVTRDCVIQIAKNNDYDVLEKGFDIEELKKSKEAFLTSTTLGIIPVIQVDDIVINEKKIGEVSQKLEVKFNDFLDDQVK
ncbi:MAG: aminotransferase class IV [Alphaproteobacteria bacterium]